MSGVAKRRSMKFVLMTVALLIAALSNTGVQAARESRGQRELRPKLDRVLRKVYRAYRDWDRLIDMLPRDVAEILRRIRNGTFETKHSHPRLETTIHRLALAMMTSSFFLGSSLMLAHKVPPAPGDLSLVGTLGLLMSMYFGYRLLRVIGKDEDSESKK
jgi:ubiquinone biosynthesis protein